MIRSWLRSVAFSGLAALTACGAGVVDTESGTASLVLTDAPTDELEVFEVDVTGVVLRKAGGATVSVLPRAARVDFAALQDIGELLTGIGLEVGVYTGLTLTLDFSNAAVYLKDSSTPATLVDTDGLALTGSLDVPIDFTVAHRPRVLARRNHLFLLDLDLNQAITVDAGNNRVTFAPVISAEFDPTDPKPIGTTGILTAVDPGAGTFTLERRNAAGDRVGTFDVRVSATTVYQVSGTVHVGASGLNALAGLTLGTSRVFAQGRIDSIRSGLTAVAVESGAGTFGNGQDWVAGHVTARGNGAGADTSLTVRGRSRQVGTGTRTFNTTHTVNVALGPTKVLRRGAANQLDSDAINVGQYVIAFGALSGTTLDATGAATGVVRMLPTSVYGLANSAPSGGRLPLDLVRIGLRPITEFDFTVNGQSQGDPDAFEVDVDGLATAGVDTGDKIRAIGWLNPVDVSTDAQLDAASLVNHTDSGQLLVCAWTPASSGAVTATSDDAITLDVSGASVKALLDGFGGGTISDTPSPTIRPRLGVGIYRIIENGGIQLHFDFPGFAAALAQRLTPSVAVGRITALGVIEPSTQSFSAAIVTVQLR